MIRELYYVINNRHKYTWTKANPMAVNGTSLQGYITTTYDKLCRKFGNPTVGDCDDKVNYEWIIEVDNNIIISIYDYMWLYRNSRNEIYDWHVGGRDSSVVNIIKEIYNE